MTNLCTALLCLLAAVIIAAFVERRSRIRSDDENAQLKRELDTAKIHRDEHGRFVHTAGPTPLSDYEEL